MLKSNLFITLFSFFEIINLFNIRAIKRHHQFFITCVIQREHQFFITCVIQKEHQKIVDYSKSS